MVEAGTIAVDVLPREGAAAPAKPSTVLGEAAEVPLSEEGKTSGTSLTYIRGGSTKLRTPNASQPIKLITTPKDLSWDAIAALMTTKHVRRREVKRSFPGPREIMQRGAVAEPPFPPPPFRLSRLPAQPPQHCSTSLPQHQTNIRLKGTLLLLSVPAEVLGLQQQQPGSLPLPFETLFPGTKGLSFPLAEAEEDDEDWGANGGFPSALERTAADRGRVSCEAPEGKAEGAETLLTGVSCPLLLLLLFALFGPLVLSDPPLAVVASVRLGVTVPGTCPGFPAIAVAP
jgi:hypothetical protein